MSSELTRHIRKLRKAKDLTQNEVADLLKIPRSTYAKKESEGDFSIDELPMLHKVLGGQKDALEGLIHRDGAYSTDNWKEVLIKSAIDTAAMNRVVLMALAEILAGQRGESMAKVLTELSKAVVDEKAMEKS